LNISGKGDYVLRAMFDLASQPVGQPVKIAEIARRQAIPQKFLELILAGLKQGGFVESRRGADGGYLLARQPEFLTVGEVLRFVEGRGDDRVARTGIPTILLLCFGSGWTLLSLISSIPPPLLNSFAIGMKNMPGSFQIGRSDLSDFNYGLTCSSSYVRYDVSQTSSSSTQRRSPK
jgi:Rrf2 family protein